MNKNGASKSWMEWSNLILALHNFPEPLQFTLNHSRQLHGFLVADSDFNRLELTPSYLQAHFGSLPPSDPRRVAWKRMVTGLIEENERALRLIQLNAGRIRRPEFRQACDSFATHADMWRYVWEASMSDQPVLDSLPRHQRIAPAFPAGMDLLLTLELAEWRDIAMQ